MKGRRLAGRWMWVTMRDTVYMCIMYMCICNAMLLLSGG